MTKETSPILDNALASLPGRVALALFTVIVVVGVLSLVFSFYLVESDFLISLILLTTLGLTSGFASRILLRRFTQVLRILTALVSLSVGMIIQGFLTPGVAGFQMITRGHAISNWVVTLQFIYCATIALLSIFAWHKPRVRIERKSVNLELRNGRTAKPHSKRPTKKPRQITQFRKKLSKVRREISLSKLMIMINGISSQINNSNRRLMSWISNRLISSPGRIRMNPSFPVILPSRKKLRLSKHSDFIKLVGDEVHNCTYCLEIVSKNDSRDRKICSICKTWHHADCWDAAGECQVPHHH